MKLRLNLLLKVSQLELKRTETVRAVAWKLMCVWLHQVLVFLRICSCTSNKGSLKLLFFKLTVYLLYKHFMKHAQRFTNFSLVLYL